MIYIDQSSTHLNRHLKTFDAFFKKYGLNAKFELIVKDGLVETKDLIEADEISTIKEIETRVQNRPKEAPKQDLKKLQTCF